MICATSCLHAQCMYACQQCWQTNTYCHYIQQHTTRLRCEETRPLSLRYLFRSTIFSSYRWKSQNIAQNNTKHRFNLYRMNTFMFSHPHVSSNVLDPQKNKQATQQMYPLCHREPRPARGPRPNLAAQSSLSSVPQSLRTRAGPPMFVPQISPIFCWWGKLGADFCPEWLR